MPNGSRQGARALPLVGLVGLLLAVPGGRGLAQVPAAAPQNPEAGAAVYGSRGCPACHAISGVGGSVGPDLRAATSSSDAVGITAALWNHIPPMAERMRSLEIVRPRLGAREAGDLLAFLYAIGASGGSGSPEAGEETFRSSGCVRCHQVGAVGGVIGPRLDRVSSLRSPIGLATGLWNHSGDMIPAMRTMGLAYPQLSAADISDLVAFLDAAAGELPDAGGGQRWVLPGEPARGADVVAQKGCQSCHTLRGRGAGTAPELARPGTRRTTEAFLAALWNKGPRMRAAFEARGQAPPRFEPGEMADLTAYLQSLEYLADAGDAGRGAGVVRTAGCLACHGWGAPGTSAEDLAASRPRAEFADRVAALWNHVSLDRVADLPPESWPSLDRGEMADVLAFLGTGAP
jgi:cytochrome c551/c552